MSIGAQEQARARLIMSESEALERHVQRLAMEGQRMTDNPKTPLSGEEIMPEGQEIDHLGDGPAPEPEEDVSAEIEAFFAEVEGGS